MSLTHILIFLIIGGVAGWLAGLLIRGRGFGIIGDIIVGVIGSFIGAWLIGHVIHLHLGRNALIGEFVAAFIGAAVLALILRLLRR